jgi:hypothetical protein
MEQQPSNHVVRVLRQIRTRQRCFYCLIDQLIDSGGFKVFFSIFIRDVGVFVCLSLVGLTNFLVIEAFIEELLFLVLRFCTTLELHKIAI